MLLIADGEPVNIDEREPQCLHHDAKTAEEDLAMDGIFSYCLTLDPMADYYVARIFGENSYLIVDDVERLPERLPAVLAAITGQFSLALAEFRACPSPLVLLAGAEETENL